MVVDDFKDHAKSRIQKNTFGVKVSRYENTLSLIWCLINKNQDNNVSVIFIEILVSTIGLICSMDSVPNFLSDDQIHLRLHMLVVNYIYLQSTI